MHPKIARLLVNLARVKKGKKVLDPFCGTGGILIEAGLMGMGILGSDVDERMVAGCRENMDFYGLHGKIKTANAMEIDKKFHDIDAIVTDPPYGRSSATFGSSIKKIYKNFLKSAARALKSKGVIVIVMPMEFSPRIEGFGVIGKYDIRVHKSLTRRILVLRKR
jgi:tRNA (guanine10-N2)-dimethyltransferase